MVNSDPPWLPWRPYFWILLLVALGLRVTHYQQRLATDSPRRQIAAKATDMEFFHDWARRLAAGDWLSRNIPSPINNESRLMLLDHWRAQKVITPEQEADPVALREHIDAQWSDWLGPPRFHQAPLYPYMLGALYTICGEMPELMIILQMALGLVALGLTIDITRRLFGNQAAQLAGVLHLAAMTLLFYEGLLLRDCWVATTTIAILWTTITARGAVSRGLLAGAVILLKPSLILLAPLGWWNRPQIPRWRFFLLWAGGAACFLVPVALRNQHFGVAHWELSSIGAITFIRSNAGDIVDGAGWQPSVQAAALMEQSEGDLLQAVNLTLKTRDSASWGQHILHKLKNLLHDFEIPNNRDFYLSRQMMPVLENGLTFGWYLPLILGACLFVNPFSPRLFPLFWTIAAQALVILIFYNLSRFRIPLLATALPLAAAGPLLVWRALRDGTHPTRLTLALPLMAAAAWFTFTPHVISLAKQSEVLLRRGNIQAARTKIEQALETAPDDPQLHWLAADINFKDNANEKITHQHLSACEEDPRFRVRALTHAGTMAFDAAQIAVRNVDSATTRRHLDEAHFFYGKAVIANPFSARTHYNLGLILEYLDDREAARQAFLQALALDPFNRLAQQALKDLEAGS